MYLSELIIVNYRSCKLLEISFQKDEPNILIGINDCGKTTILKSVGLLLDDKPSYNFIRDNSSKKDFSNSPLTSDQFSELLTRHKLPLIPYDENQTIVLGKFKIEESDIDTEELSTYSNQLLWTIEKADDDLWFGKAFESNSSNGKSFLLTFDHFQDDKALELCSMNATDLNRKMREFSVSSEDVENTNKTGRFSNLEKVRAVYSKVLLEQTWTSYKIDKGDKTVFPQFRYLDWNCSLEDIKKTATDAMAARIDAHIKPLKAMASNSAKDAELEVNEDLKILKESIGEVIPNITAIKTKVFFDVKESITDILINKANSDGDIHLDLQGEGVKRQIWFALIKAGAVQSIRSGITNKRFIWAFDEPETHLFPSAQREFFEIIKQVSTSNVQTLVSTHSTVFIDKSKLQTIRSVSLKQDSYTEFSECSSVDDIFTSLELRNSDFLFYDKFLVIEGDTEAYLIPALYRLHTGSSLSDHNIQLINLTGKSKWVDSKKALENVLQGFKKSMDYVVYLFDADMRPELGANAITENFFFAGKQDIEDSISNDIWIQFVAKATEDKVILTVEDIQTIKNGIPEDIAIPSNQKFFKVLEKTAKAKLQEITDEPLTYNLLPTKGNDSAQLLIELIDSIDSICPNIGKAFDRLRLPVPSVVGIPVVVGGVGLDKANTNKE